MTRRRRSRRRPQGAWPAPTAPGQASTLTRTAELLRTELRRRGVDAAPLEGLPAALGVTEELLRAAIDRFPELGIAGAADEPVVWWVNTAPLAAGFEPFYDGARLTLRLAAAGPARRPLVISGRHLDPQMDVEVDVDRDTHRIRPTTYGELAFALARLTLLAARWLPAGGQLFQLINRAWKAPPIPVRSRGQLHVYCADLGEQIATPAWLGNLPASQLELVTWIDPDDGLVLMNVYPCITTHSIFDRRT